MQLTHSIEGVTSKLVFAHEPISGSGPLRYKKPYTIAVYIPKHFFQIQSRRLNRARRFRSQSNKPL